MIAMAMSDPFVVANGQTNVTIPHIRVNGVVTVSAPNLSARSPDEIRPKPDPALAMESK